MSRAWHICCREWAMTWRHKRMGYLCLPLVAAAAQALFGAGPALATSAASPMAWPAWAAVAVAPWLLGDPLGRERRGGTFELLWSMPVHDLEIAIGKFAAGFGLCLLALLPVAWPLCSGLSAGLESPKVVVGSLAALASVAAAVCAVALASSALATGRRAGQLGASIIGLALWGLGWPASWLPAGLAPWLDYLSLPHHMQALAQGKIDSRDLVYFLTITVGALAIGTSGLCRDAA